MPMYVLASEVPLGETIETCEIMIETFVRATVTRSPAVPLNLIGIASPLTEVTVTGGPPGVIESDERAALLRAALREIDPRYREVIFLVYVEDRKEPGANNDRYWIEVKNPPTVNGGVPVTQVSLPSLGGAAANAKTIDQGNIQVPQPQMTTLEDLRVIPVSAGTTAQPLLGDVAQIENATIVGEYDRVNGQRMVTLTANVAGEDLGRALDQVNAAIRRAGDPPRGATVVSRISSLPAMFTNSTL